MVQKGKRLISLVLVLAMMLSMTVTAGAAPLVVGTNGKTIYLSMQVTDASGNEKTSAQTGNTLYVRVNFAGNSTVLEESVRNYNVLMSFDGTKMTFSGIDRNVPLTIPQANSPKSGIIKAGWSDNAGIIATVIDGEDEKDVVQESGLLTIFKLKATSDLTADDIASIQFLDSYNTDTLRMGDYSVVIAPALDVSVKDGVTLYIPPRSRISKML